jgi:hypothetical protein
MSISPPIAYAESINSNNLFDDLLKKCIHEFLEVVVNKGTFPPELMERSFQSSTVIL